MGVSLPVALLVCLAAGVVWQIALVVAVVGLDQRRLRWSTVRAALCAPFTAQAVEWPHRGQGVARERRDPNPRAPA